MMHLFLKKLFYRRSLVWLTSLLFMLGCTAQAADGPTPVTFMVFGDPPEQAVFQSVVDAFHAQNSDVQVELIGLPSKGDYLTRLSADFAAGAPPDVFLLNYRRLAQYHNRDALEPLGPMLTNSDKLDESEFYQIALDAFRDSSGTLVCIPQNISSQVIYYNKDLFDAAGLPYPADDWTWAEFRQTALALTLPDSNGDGEADQYGLGLEPALIRMAPFIWQNGGTLVDDVTHPTRLTLDTAEAREAMQFVLNLPALDGVVPNATAEAIQAQELRFYDGTIAMYINSRRIVPVMREVTHFNWDVAPLPRGPQTASVLHSDGYCMARSAEVKTAAWAFIEFAVSEEGQKLAAKLGRTVPSLKHVAESPVFLDPTQSPAHAQVWLDIVPHIRILPRLQNWVAIERTAGIELERAYMSNTTLDAAIQMIETQAEEEMNPLR